MREIRFYHLQRSSLEAALPALLGKALQGGRKILVKTDTAGRRESLNEHLWAYRPESFLPHGSEKDGNAALQPIWITEKDENPNGADLLILIDGARFEPALQKAFPLCCEIFDGADPQALKAARNSWKTCRQEPGVTVTYWQETDSGGWVEKAQENPAGLTGSAPAETP